MGLMQQNKLLQQQLQALQEALLRFRGGVQGAADAPMGVLSLHLVFLAAHE